MIVALAGFLAGLQHVVSGPDHLAAVAPLAALDRQAAWRSGMTWAVGHAGGVIAIALLALGLREISPLDPAILSGWSERLVGLVLVAIGLWGLRKALSRRLHAHVHDHGGERHLHIHVHESGTAHGTGPAQAATHPCPPHHHSHATLAVGTLHGLAGGSHLLGVLPALTLGASEAVVYLAAYGAGTLAAMAGFAWSVGWLATRAERIGLPWARALMIGCSTAAVLVGIYWIGQGWQPHA